MGAKPAVNSLFKKIKTLEGSVPAFTSHGTEKTEDVRAFVFTNGNLKDGYLGVIPWSATFPTFKPDSCATALTRIHCHCQLLYQIHRRYRPCRYLDWPFNEKVWMTKTSFPLAFGRTLR